LFTVSTCVELQSAATCSRWFLARGFFYPEDGGDTFLRNIGSHKNYTVPHPRKRHSSGRINISPHKKFYFFHTFLGYSVLQQQVFFIMNGKQVPDKALGSPKIMTTASDVL
jgi:hypothetical protein